jgi:DNA repair protein RecO (recombination protein O)
MAGNRRVQRQPGYVLSRRAYSESSLLIDAFCRDFGRVPLLAKGARKLKSPFRGVLQAFSPLSIDWSGRRELVTLTRAEQAGSWIRLTGRGLICAWYANELLIRFLHRGDPHEALFDAYRQLLQRLGGEADTEWPLRLFEVALLRDVGFGMVLDREVLSHEPIEPARRYAYVSDRGPMIGASDSLSGVPVSGATLIALKMEQEPDEIIQREAKRLTRQLLAERLDGRMLRSRGVFQQMYGQNGGVRGDS